MVDTYIPKQGDIVLIDFNPTRGHEQNGYRPAIVVSNNAFNKYTGMAMLCPITSNTKDFPTHYVLEDSKKISGAVLCEHVRSIDYTSRKIKKVEKASDNDLLSVMTLMASCIDSN